MKKNENYERLQMVFHGYAEDFRRWRRAHEAEVFDTAAEAGIETSLKVGDKVTFTNSYGVKFPGHRILGFCKTDEYGRCVFLDVDCYRISFRPESLTLEESR